MGGCYINPLTAAELEGYMIVKELIEELKDCNPSSEVRFKDQPINSLEELPFYGVILLPNTKTEQNECISTGEV